MIRWLPLVALMACGKGDGGSTSVPTGTSAGTTGGTPGGSVTTGVTTGTPGGTTTTGWRPTRYNVVYGWFAVQSDQATAATDVDLFGTPIDTPMQLAVRLADDTIDTVGLTPDNHCDVVFISYTSVPAASWLADTDAWFALEMPSDSQVSEENCLTLPLAADWASPGTRVGAHRWGMTVESVVPDDVDAWLSGSTTTSYLMDRVLGATWWTDAAAGTVGNGTETEIGVAFAEEIDGTGQIVRDAYHDSTLIPASAVPKVGGGVNDGFFRVTPLGGWRDASEL